MACQRCDNGRACVTHAAVAIPGLGEDNRCRNCRGTGEADHGHYAPGVCSRCKGTGIEPCDHRTFNGGSPPCTYPRGHRGNHSWAFSERNKPEPSTPGIVPAGFCPECGTRIAITRVDGVALCGPCAGRARGPSIRELEDRMMASRREAERAEAAYDAACERAHAETLRRRRANIERTPGTKLGRPYQPWQDQSLV